MCVFTTIEIKKIRCSHGTAIGMTASCRAFYDVFNVFSLSSTSSVSLAGRCSSGS